MKTENFKWNYDYIIQNKLDDEVLTEAGIELEPSEVFVEHPEHEKYYVSQYGRAVSLKRNKVTLLGAFVGGQPDGKVFNMNYLYIQMQNRENTRKKPGFQ